jgi:hypothetical protein
MCPFPGFNDQLSLLNFGTLELNLSPVACFLFEVIK